MKGDSILQIHRSPTCCAALLSQSATVECHVEAVAVIADAGAAGKLAGLRVGTALEVGTPLHRLLTVFLAASAAVETRVALTKMLFRGIHTTIKQRTLLEGTHRSWCVQVRF